MQREKMYIIGMNGFSGISQTEGRQISHPHRAGKGPASPLTENGTVVRLMDHIQTPTGLVLYIFEVDQQI